jgi:hypothetical protein
MGPDLLAERNRPSGHVRERDDLFCPAKIYTGRPNNNRGTPGGLHGAWRDKSTRLWCCINHSWMSWSPGDPENNAVNRTRNKQFWKYPGKKTAFCTING